MIQSVRVRELNGWRRILSAPLFMLIKLLLVSLRFSESEAARAIMSSPKPTVGLAWHSRIAFLAKCKWKYRNNLRMSGLISASRDGAYLAELFRILDIENVRGSSKRGGARAILGLVEKLQEGCDVFITPDGPRGPKEKVKSGFLNVMKMSGARLLILKIEASPCIKLPTWDSFLLPLPFAKVRVDALEVSDYAELEKSATLKNMSPSQYVESLMGKSV